MPRVTYNTTQGLVQSAGSGISFTVGSGGFSLDALPTSPVQAKTASTSVTTPGVYTLSGTSALTLTLPAPSAVPGGVFVLRNLSAKAHVLSGTGGVNFTDGTVMGGQIALAAAVGNSVSVISDGLNYCVLAKSGTLTLS